MGSENAQYLAENGPVPGEDLPVERGTAGRMAGVRRFTLRGSGGGPGQMGGPVTSVYYLKSHAKADVIRAFLDANPGLVESTDKRGFHHMIRAHGPSWVDAARAVTDDYFEAPESRGEQPGAIEEKTCPFCEADVKLLPRHLADDCPDP